MNFSKKNLFLFFIHILAFISVFSAVYFVVYIKNSISKITYFNEMAFDIIITYMLLSLVFFIFFHVRNIRKLRSTESTLKSLLLNNNDSWIWETDENFVYTYVDGFYKKILGMNHDEIIGKTPIDLLNDDNEKDHVRKLMAKLKSEAVPLVDFEIKLTNSLNEIQFIRINISPIKSGKGKLTGFRGINKDISLRKNLETHLTYANYRVEETISSYNKVNIWEYEVKTGTINILSYSYPYRDVKFDPYEIKTLERLITITHPADIEKIREISGYYLSGGRGTRTFEFRVKDADNKWILFNTTLFPVNYDENGSVLKIFGVNRHVSFSSLVDDKFKAQQIFLDTILSNLPLGIFAKDPNDNWNYIIWNKYMSELFEREEKDVIGKSDFDFLPKKIAESYYESNEKFFRSEKTIDKNEEILMLPGRKTITALITRIKIFDFSGNVGMLLMTMEDISRQKRMEIELRQAQKMDALGRLAGGIAHNFNNLLQVIIGYSEMLLYRVDSANRKSVEKIIGATQNARNMTKHLLTFSRKESIKLSVLNINNLVQSFVEVTGRIISEGIEISFDKEIQLPEVVGDENLLHQVLMNLFINSRDAMNGHGLIHIKTSVADFEYKETIGNTVLEKGCYVVVSVSDNGPGIPQEIIGSVFDPFFTTKEEGKGTGLGLATVYGIIQDHRGAICVESLLNHGAVFKIYLPAAKQLNK